MNFVQLHFNLRHAWHVCVISVYGCHEHRNLGTSIPSPGCDGEGRGEGAGEILTCLDPRQVLYKPSLLVGKNEKTKRILMCEVTVFCVQ